MSATIIHLDAFRRAAHAQVDRLLTLGNEQWARVIPAARYVPLLGRVNEREPGDLPQLEDGE